MINKEYKERLQEIYLNEFERETLRAINQEQNKYFSPVDYYTLTISEGWV